MSAPSAPPARHAIFLNGPIGVGKTVLGRALAAELGGCFIDSDDLGDPAKPWFGEVLTVSRALVLAVLRAGPLVVIAKPLRARDWIFFRGHLGMSGVTAWCVTLQASAEAITASGRGREFSAGERQRIGQMIDQGYAARPFSHAIVPTDQQSLTATVTLLAERCRILMSETAKASR